MKTDATTANEKPLSHRPRTGTETRKRSRVVGIRMTDAEYERTEADAAKDGLTLASYGRLKMVSEPQTRTRRRPRADVAALSKACGELNRIGGNINQIARAVNLGEQPCGADITQAMAELHEALRLVHAAMGFKS